MKHHLPKKLFSWRGARQVNEFFGNLSSLKNSGRGDDAVVLPL